MRKRTLGGLAGLGLLALVFVFRPHRESAPKPTEGERRTVAPIDRPVEGAPCRVEGLVEGGIAVRVRIHGAAAELDVDAELLRGGRGFTAGLPEQGRLSVVATSDDGRTATSRAFCPGSGHVQVGLRFAPRDPRAARVSGRCVYLETGAGVADAVIRGSLGDVLVWSGLTDQEGRFGIDVPPGTFAVECEKDAEKSDPRRADVEPKGAAEIELFVEAQAAIAGIVADENDRPAPRVQVLARSGASAKFERATTGDDGRFVLRGLEAGPVVVEAHAGGRFGEAHTVAKVELPYAEVRLILKEGSLAITGVVRDGDGPIAEAAVEVVGMGPDASRTPLRRGTSSGEDGRFTVGGLVPGSYVLSGRADGRARTEVNVEVSDGTASMDLFLETLCTTHVEVRPRDPVLSVVVEAGPVKLGDAQEVEAFGETGEVIELVGPPGRSEISARTIGGVVRTASVAAELCAAPVVLSLEPKEDRGAIEVRVEDPDGKALPNGRVWILGGSIGVSSSLGTVRFEGLEPGLYGVAALDVDPVEVDVQAGVTAPVRLVVGRERGQIEGVVVQGDGEVEGAGIRASCADSGLDRGLENAGIVARSGADGRFAFEPEDGGVCTVRAEHPTLGKSRVVTLTTNGSDARLELMGSGTIAGRVTRDADGAAVERYAVSARAVDRAGDLDARTVYVDDPSGAYRIDGVVPGRVSVSVTAANGRAHREVELSAGGERTGVDLAIFEDAEVRGRIVSKERPVIHAEVTVRDTHGDPRGQTVSGAEGRFSVRVPSGDLLRLFVSAEGHYLWGSQPFDLEPSGKEFGDISPNVRGGPEEKEGGIGIMFEGDPRGVRIIRFVSSSPAREAGLEVGDLITAIEGLPAGREPLVNWVVHFRGPPGTPVVLQVERGTAPPFSATVIRRSIGLDPVP